MRLVLAGLSSSARIKSALVLVVEEMLSPITIGNKMLNKEKARPENRTKTNRSDREGKTEILDAGQLVRIELYSSPAGR